MKFKKTSSDNIVSQQLHDASLIAIDCMFHHLVGFWHMSLRLSSALQQRLGPENRALVRLFHACKRRHCSQTPRGSEECPNKPLWRTQTVCTIQGMMLMVNTIATVIYVGSHGQLAALGVMLATSCDEAMTGPQGHEPALKCLGLWHMNTNPLVPSRVSEPKQASS